VRPAAWEVGQGKSGVQSVECAERRVCRALGVRSRAFRVLGVWRRYVCDVGSAVLGRSGPHSEAGSAVRGAVSFGGAVGGL
jgi:hypothetical protein